MVKKAVNFTPEVLLSAPRRSAGVPNPSGTRVLYTTSTYSFERHEKTIELRLLDVESNNSHQLAHDDEISDLNWLNDDEFVCLQAEKDNTTSIYWASVGAILGKGKAVLGETHYVAGKIEAPASDLKIAPVEDGGFAVVVAAQATPEGKLFNPDKAPKTHSTGRLYKSLFVRHWDRYESQEKNSLWYSKLTKAGNGKWAVGEFFNALDSTALESPISPFGGTDNFDVNAVGIIFVAKDPKLDPALNTKTDVYVARIDDWGAKRLVLHGPMRFPAFEGAATGPVWRSDGKMAAFLMMATNGYESDANFPFLLKYDDEEFSVGSVVIASDVAEIFDVTISSVKFSPEPGCLLLTAEHHGRTKLFSTPFTEKGETKTLPSSGSVSDVRCLADGNVFLSGSSLVDNSLYSIINVTKMEQEVWTNSNSAGRLGLSSKQVDCIWTPANNPEVNKRIMSWVVRPSNFDPKEKYPVAYLIHGGPQGAWLDAWSTRWNPAVFAEQGYIVIAPNITGSTGYGQKFTNAINQNWGGDPYEDIVKVFEWVGENMPEADNDRAVQLGASYGGFMANWIQGHDLGRKFKAIVCHDGIFSTTGLLSTEELYFPFHDLGGEPWSSSEQSSRRNFGQGGSKAWQKWDPSQHLANWSTPQLVIHSSKDYRLCISEGLAAFNVLQTKGVPSQFLTYPDENHFVLKPENSLTWHKVVLNWINKYADLPPFADENDESAAFWGGRRGRSDGLVEMTGQGHPST